jgi:hypothetical protein
LRLRVLALSLAVAVAGALAAGRILRAPARASATSEEDANASTAIRTDAGRARSAVEIGSVESVEVELDHEAFGRVLDPVPFVDCVLARRGAARTLAFAEIETRRVERLHAHDNNASTREVETARLALERAQLELRAASARVAATWGAGAAGRRDLEALADRIATGSASLGRVDLPAGEPAPEPPERLEVSAAGQGALPAAALVVGRAPATDPLLQGEGYLVVLDPPPPAGSSLVARVPQRQPLHGLWVPTSAIVWRGGSPVVFVPSGAAFESRPVRHLGSLRDGWVVEGALRPGDRVVLRGAQQILSSEILSAQAPE